MQKYSLKKLASFSTVRYFSFFILTLRGFLVASVLGPAAFGLYSIVIILQQQFSLFGLGVRESVSLQLADSRNDDQFAQISVTAFWFTVMVIIALNLISLSMSGLDNLWDYETYNLKMALKLAAFTIATEILASISRARGMLGTVMVAEFGYATLTFLIFWLVSQYFPLADTFLYALLVCNIVIFCYYLLMHMELFKTATFSFENVKQLIVLGIPILIQNTCAVFLYSAGHYYLTIYSDVEQLSIYSFAFSLAIAAQIGVQSVLWAKFFEMLTLFGHFSGSESSKKEVADFKIKVATASQAFLVLAVIAIKLFLIFFITKFFPEFVDAAPLVIIIFMALYWPILAISEATLLLAKKRFAKLYLSSGTAIITMGLLFINFSFNEDVFSNFDTTDIAAFVIFAANFIFYCMLKIQGGTELGISLMNSLSEITKTLILISILAGCYYHSNPLIPVLIMIIILFYMVVPRKFFKS